MHGTFKHFIMSEVSLVPLSCLCSPHCELFLLCNAVGVCLALHRSCGGKQPGGGGGGRGSVHDILHIILMLHPIGRKDDAMQVVARLSQKQHLPGVLAAALVNKSYPLCTLVRLSGLQGWPARKTSAAGLVM